MTASDKAMFKVHVVLAGKPIEEKIKLLKLIAIKCENSAEKLTEKNNATNCP